MQTGFCYDLDECEEPDGIGIPYCGDKATCVNTEGSFTCDCHNGYENHVANVGCSDIDECLTDQAPNCKLGTNCINNDGGYTCECRENYEGDPYVNCYDIDECELGGRYACTFGAKTGLPDMSCVNWPGTYQCTDGAVMMGGNSGVYRVIKSANKEYYR